MTLHLEINVEDAHIHIPFLRNQQLQFKGQQIDN